MLQNEKMTTQRVGEFVILPIGKLSTKPSAPMAFGMG